MYPFKSNIKCAISKKPLQKTYIIMYIENQASRQSPPPSLRTFRQPIAVWRKFREERGGDPPRQRSRDTDSANTHGIRTFLANIHGRPIKGHDDRFLLIARLILILKGYT